MSEIDMIKSIWEHITVMNAEQGRQAILIGQLSTKLDLMEKLGWIIITAIITGGVVTLWGIISTRGYHHHKK